MHMASVSDNATAIEVLIKQSGSVDEQDKVIHVAEIRTSVLISGTGSSHHISYYTVK